MHDILTKEGINVFSNPMNLMFVSPEYHATLHTDVYIMHVYSYIEPAKGDKEALYAALFLLRLEIAASDPGALGY